jgi:two-component system sensor histidine kinase PilS (NtrC family)
LDVAAPPTPARAPAPGAHATVEFRSGWNESLQRSLQWLTGVRITVVLVILASAVLLHASSGVDLPVTFLYFLFGLTGWALFLGVFQWSIGRWIPSAVSAYVQMLGDLVLITVLVYSSGGPYSVFNFLYLVTIGVAAYLLLRPGAVLMASGAAVMYGAVVELLAKGVLPPPPLTPAADWTGGQVRYNFWISVVGFYGVAFMTAYLSEKLRAARSELARRQKALQRLQNLHGNVIATMSSGLLTTDSRQRLTFINRAGGELLGVDPARAAGLSLANFGFALPENWATVWDSGRSWDSFRGEVEIERDGSRRVLGYSLRGLRDADGELGLLILFQDLTEIKKLERRARFNEQLAAVGELAAGIAHEIRNPLASISGSVQVLSNELSVGSAERRLMEIIVSESNRLSKILEEFLRFVRPQERRVAEFDVANAIAEVMDIFRLSDEVSDAHRIEVDVEPSHSTILGDRDQIRQIVYNVAKNAVRAMSAGGTLTVLGREEDGWYSIRFTDTGRGMSEEELSRLFTPFSTAFDGGTGLGMAIVRRIVEDHGGAIDAESTPGEGTTVTVLLPRAGVRFRTEPAPVPVEAAAS